MANGSYKIKVRPLRIAFFVDPQDRKGLQEAIEINSLLWGGEFNPIIPAFRRTPNNWEPRRITTLPKPTKIIDGYLDGFDPDLVVKIGICETRDFNIGNREVITSNALLGELIKEGRTGYGIGLFDILNEFIRKELKYTRTKPLEITFPRISKAHHLFLSSVFGVLPDDVHKIIDEEFKSSLGNKIFKCTINNFSTLLEPRNIFTRRITSWKLNRYFENPTLFVCDAKKCLDIIDYWNLRAAGYYVIPIPIQAKKIENVRSLASKFINDNYLPYRHNPNMFSDTTVQVSRSLKEEEVSEFVKSLKIPVGDITKRSKYSVRWWYPRLWDTWARDNASEGIKFAYSHEVEHSLSEGQNRLEIRTEDPKIDISGYYSGHTKFANEFSFTFYEKKEPMAEIFPEGSRELSTAIGRFGYREWRFSKTGPVFLANNHNDLIFMDLPRAEPVMIEWLRERGWKVELSAPGRIAKQIFKQVGGRWGINLFAHEGIIRLMGSLETEKGVPRQRIIQELNKVIKDDGLFLKADKFLNLLLDVKVIKLGAQIKCPICTRYNWYELNKLDYMLDCRFCLSSYEPPTCTPKDIKWSFQHIGAPRNENNSVPVKIIIGLYCLNSRRLTLCSCTKGIIISFSSLLSPELNVDNINVASGNAFARIRIL